MRLIATQLTSWLDASPPAPFALATVTSVSGSAPRAPGACMLIEPARPRFLGSVSSGCLETEVIDAAALSLRDGAVRRLRFGPDGQPPWSDGLSCGGWIEVRVEPWWAFHPRENVRALSPLVRRWLDHDEPGVILSTDTHHAAVDLHGNIGGDAGAFSDALINSALARLRAGLSSLEDASAGEPVFLRILPSRPRFVIVGATDLAIHLVPLARQSGFSTLVIDPRDAYAAADRFPAPPDRLIRSWPRKIVEAAGLGARDVALAISHDPKIDDVALLTLLKTDVGYLGALGSSRSHASRLVRLGPQVADPGVLARIHGPAGIHLGTPDASGIALGIMAGIARWQATEERSRAAPALGDALPAAPVTFANEGG